jgi:hypothetical protein
MSRAVQHILDQVRSLSPEDRASLVAELQAAYAERVFGKYAFVPTSAEALCERRHEEIKLEDQANIRS